MRLIYEAKSAWPPNAWLALLKPGDASVLVRHGDGVQTSPDWFCEAAWDGEFEQGGFDLSDVVTGSGGRLRDGVLTLVSSGSTVDRLQFSRSGGRIFASNSLVCLFAATGYSPDATYGGYYADFRSGQPEDPCDLGAAVVIVAARPVKSQHLAQAGAPADGGDGR